MDFVITGLPRSRTTWLANFMNTDGVLCYHQALSRAKDIEDYVINWYTEPSYKSSLIVGDSGMEYLMVDFDQWKTQAGTRFVLIDKPKDAVLKSYEKHKESILANKEVGDLAWKAKDSIDFFISLLESKKKRSDVLVVPFFEVNNHLEEIWNFCTDGTFPFNKYRAKELCNFNVQKHWEVCSSLDDLQTFTKTLQYLVSINLINMEEINSCLQESGVTGFMSEVQNEDETKASTSTNAV